MSTTAVFKALVLIAAATHFAVATPAGALTFDIFDVVATQSVVGTAQTTFETRIGTHADKILTNIRLPTGDPFSSASISVEFSILSDAPGAMAQLNANLGPLPIADVLALGPGPVPWDLSVTLVRLDQPSVLFSGNEADTQTTDPIDNFEWSDVALTMPSGRYRFTVQASQVGGQVIAGVGATLFINPVPEPSAAFVFAVGLVIATESIRRSSRC